MSLNYSVFLSVVLRVLRGEGNFQKSLAKSANRCVARPRSAVEKSESFFSQQHARGARDELEISGRLPNAISLAPVLAVVALSLMDFAGRQARRWR